MNLKKYHGRIPVSKCVGMVPVLGCSSYEYYKARIHGYKEPFEQITPPDAVSATAQILLHDPDMLDKN